MMHGFWKMLTGEGARLNRERRNRFKQALPQSYPFVIGDGDEAVVRTGEGNNHFRSATREDLATLPSHPAYSGEFSNTMIASNYRKAVYGGGGPRASSQVEKEAESANAHDSYYEYVRQSRADGFEPLFFEKWLREFGIPLPGQEVKHVR